MLSQWKHGQQVCLAETCRKDDTFYLPAQKARDLCKGLLRALARGQ